MSHFVHRRTQLTDCDALVEGLKALGFNPVVNDAKDHVIVNGDEVGHQPGSWMDKILGLAAVRGSLHVRPINFRQGSDGVFSVAYDDDHLLGAIACDERITGWGQIDRMKRKCTEFMEGANRAGFGIDRNFENVVYTEYTIAKIKAIAAERGMAVADVIRNPDGTCRVVVEDKTSDDVFGDVFTESAPTVDAFAEVYGG